MMMMPDGNVVWAPAAFREGLRISQNDGIDLIYASAKPNSSLVSAVRLGRRLGVPTVVDLRDPWTLERDFNPLTPVHAAAQRRWESYVFMNSTKIIVNTSIAREQLLDAYPTIHPRKVVCIPNGFDSDDRPEPDRGPPSSKMSILYTGTLTGGRDPLPFLRAIRELFSEDEEARRELQVEFLTEGPAAREAARQAGVEDLIRFSSIVPHSECLKRQASSDVLLLIQFKGTYADAQLPAKIYEYLGLACRPVLALATKGAVMDLIGHTKGGMVVEPDDIEGIKSAIRQFWTIWKPQHRIPWEIDYKALDGYEARRLAGRLAEQFNEAVATYSSNGEFEPARIQAVDREEAIELHS